MGANGTDKSELIDIYDEHERWLGVKDREHVHRDGDWHRCFHCWIVSCEPVPSLVVQRRTRGLSDFPGMLDVSVSGHQRAGETLDQAIRRELSEELGVGVEAASLFHILRYRVDLRDGGRVFREFTDVLLLRDDRPIGAYIPRVAEIGALLMLPLSSGVELWAERTKITTAIEHSPDARVGRAIEIRRENFVGSKDTRYFQTVLESATAACAT